jgi:hypothetical protein
MAEDREEGKNHFIKNIVVIIHHHKIFFGKWEQPAL